MKKFRILLLGLFAVCVLTTTASAKSGDYTGQIIIIDMGPNDPILDIYANIYYNMFYNYQTEEYVVRNIIVTSCYTYPWNRVDYTYTVESDGIRIIGSVRWTEIVFEQFFTFHQIYNDIQPGGGGSSGGGGASK